MTVQTIGIDIGGTNVRLAVVDARGEEIARLRAPSPADDWDAIRTQVLASVSTVRADNHVDAIGVGAAGMVDRDGVIHYAPNVAGFLGAPVQAEIAAATGLPTVVDNDANAAAWGELVHGAARGVRDALVITLGTGVGGGIVSNGRVLRGAHGFAAEVGHFTVDPNGPLCACGEVGHWEAVASGTALGRMAREAARLGDAPAVLKAAGGDPEAVNGTHVTEAARAGDPGALALIDRYAAAVAVGFVGLANILDPEIIVVSGGLATKAICCSARSGPRFDGHVEGAQYRPAPPIVAAELGGRGRDDRRRDDGPGARPVRVGITLPSFRDDPEIPIAVAVAAEEAGVDGVFAYDHLFRIAADGHLRPALECTTLLGAVAAETSRVALGTLVAARDVAAAGHPRSGARHDPAGEPRPTARRGGCR